MRFKNPLFFAVLSFMIGGAAVTAAVYMPHVLHAQTADTSATDANAARRAALTAQLNELNTEIAANQAQVNTLDAQGQSLSRDVQILTADIKSKQLQIQAAQVALDEISGNISTQTKTIGTLSSKLDSEHSSLAQIIRNTAEIDDYSIVEVALSSQDVSGFFSDLDSYTTVKEALGFSVNEIKDTRTQTEKEKDALETQYTQKQQLTQLQLEAAQKVKDQQAQKQTLLTQTKGQEANYKSIIATQQKTVAQIQAELFALAGGSKAIPLPTAIADAKIASGITHVRPALILAILSQESDLGNNVGQCYVTDLATGAGRGNASAATGVMKAPRDTVPFKAIMDALGRDWSTTAVSCPQGNGYGGAMGPTQFIPSTWVLYQSRIESALNVAATDPWNPLHAIMATALLLSDNGAGAGTDASERKAAGEYFAGGNWATAGQVYANSVMEKAAQFQSDIDTLAGS